MKKTEFLQQLAKNMNISHNEAEKCLRAVLDSIEDALVRDKKLVLREFGSFNVLQQEAKSARNPATGELVALPETCVIRFKPSAFLKSQINARPSYISTT